MLKMPTQQETECLDILKQDIERHFSDIRFRNYKGELYQRTGRFTKEDRHRHLT